MNLSAWCNIYEELRDKHIDDPRILRGSGIEVGNATTYGELTPVFVDQIRRELKLTEDDLFYDIGSGIGNVVLQLAAQVGCEAYGIEIRPELGEIARNMHDGLLKYMEKQNDCKVSVNARFFTGNALSDDFDYSDASVILVNNWCFDAVLEQKLFEKFEKTLKEGTRIICLKDVFPRFRPNSLRSKSHPGQRFRYPWKKFLSCDNAISWDSKSVYCYVYEIIDVKNSLSQANSIIKAISVKDSASSKPRFLLLQEARKIREQMRSERFIISNSDDLKNQKFISNQRRVIKAQAGAKNGKNIKITKKELAKSNGKKSIKTPPTRRNGRLVEKTKRSRSLDRAPTSKQLRSNRSDSLGGDDSSSEGESSASSENSPEINRRGRRNSDAAGRERKKRNSSKLNKSTNDVNLENGYSVKDLSKNIESSLLDTATNEADDAHANRSKRHSARLKPKKHQQNLFTFWSKVPNIRMKSSDKVSPTLSFTNIFSNTVPATIDSVCINVNQSTSIDPSFSLPALFANALEVESSDSSDIENEDLVSPVDNSRSLHKQAKSKSFLQSLDVVDFVASSSKPETENGSIQQTLSSPWSPIDNEILPSELATSVPSLNNSVSEIEISPSSTPLPTMSEIIEKLDTPIVITSIFRANNFDQSMSLCNHITDPTTINSLPLQPPHTSNPMENTHAPPSSGNKTLDNNKIAEIFNQSPGKNSKKRKLIPPEPDESPKKKNKKEQIRNKRTRSNSATGEKSPTKKQKLNNKQSTKKTSKRTSVRLKSKQVYEDTVLVRSVNPFVKQIKLCSLSKSKEASTTTATTTIATTTTTTEIITETVAATVTTTTTVTTTLMKNPTSEKNAAEPAVAATENQPVVNSLSNSRMQEVETLLDTHSILNNLSTDYTVEDLSASLTRTLPPREDSLPLIVESVESTNLASSNVTDSGTELPNVAEQVCDAKEHEETSDKSLAVIPSSEELQTTNKAPEVKKFKVSLAKTKRQKAKKPNGKKPRRSIRCSRIPTREDMVYYY